MVKRFALAGAVSMLFTGGTPAQPVASPEQCLGSTFEIAESAEQKQLQQVQFDSLEELLTRMEDACDAHRFSEAMAIGQDLKDMIEKPARSGQVRSVDRLPTPSSSMHIQLHR
jgi:hypothetical protein